jgi:hypothetical protein
MNPHLIIEPEELEQIGQYLAEGLPDKELAIFEQRLDADPQWRQKVKEVRLLSIGIREVAVERLLHEFHHNIAYTAPNSRVVRMATWKKLAVAAILILAAGTGLWRLRFPQQAEQKLFATYFRPDPGLATTMGVAVNYEFEKAMVDYKTRNYRQAIDGWEKLRRSNPANDTLSYFIAMALLAGNEPSKAIILLDDVIASRKEAFFYDACWYKGLALLRIGRKKDAANAIKISNHPKATALLKKIE